MIRIGILGAGFMGSTHARALSALSGVEIGSIYGLGEDRAMALSAEIGAPWTTNLDQVIADPEIDAIDICLPTPQHRAVAEAAIGAGKHVLLEKPIALTMDDANALVTLSESTDRVFMIAHVLRFWPEYVEVQRLAASGDYGRPVSGLAYRRQPFPAWSALFARSELTGGAVIDMMIHDYDALNWIFGPPKAVTARGRRNPRSGGWDQVQVMIDYDEGTAVVDGGMMMPESYPFTSAFQILCESGAMEYTFRAGGRSVEVAGSTNELRLYPNQGDSSTLTVDQQDAYSAELAYFLTCVRDGTSPVRASPEDARLALKTSLAARDALETGKTVEM